MSDTALKHVEYLSNTIGPRGSTTPKEKEGHDYVQQVLGDLGCNPRAESFQSSPSAYLPFILGVSVMLVAEALFWLLGRAPAGQSAPDAQAGALAAAVLGIVVTGATLFEFMSEDNPLRWFMPTAPSQNVIGVTPASGEASRRVAVLAHVDSHRTPLIWQSRNTFKLYRVISTLGALSLLALCVLFVAGIFTPEPGLRTASLVPAAILVLGLLMALQAHLTRFTPGANDNASGVGVMLALAGRLRQEPLERTEVWWVATGCEEVGAYGSADFVRRYKQEFKDGAVIVIDNIAGAGTGPVYLTSEALLQTYTYPAQMVKLAEDIARDSPELGSRPAVQRGAYSDAIYALKAGLACLTLMGYTQDGWIPNWHNPSDTFANVDADAVDRTERFVWEALRRLDRPVDQKVSTG